MELATPVRPDLVLSRDDPLAVLPALVTVGTRDGNQLLINLEAFGSVAIDAEPDGRSSQCYSELCHGLEPRSEEVFGSHPSHQRRNWRPALPTWTAIESNAPGIAGG